VAYLGDKKTSARLRFGSQGELVASVQDSLKERKFYEGVVDGVFGERTMRAVLNFQEAFFGQDADDGIVGPITARALGLAWQDL
jgi:N-acetylmuramoyl-L-alanine amidase